MSNQERPTVAGVVATDCEAGPWRAALEAGPVLLLERLAVTTGRTERWAGGGRK